MIRKATRTVERRRGSAIVSLSLSVAAAALIPASVVAIAALVSAGRTAPVADVRVPDTTMLAPDRTAQAGPPTLYGVQNGFENPELNRLHVIDPSNGDILSSVQITVPGFEVETTNGLAIDPTDGEMYAVVRLGELPLARSGPRPVAGASGPPLRALITLDRATAVGALVGELPTGLAGLAFKADGTLLGVSGDGGSQPETLFEIDKTDATVNLILALGNGDDGEAIACHENGLLYHASGIDPGEMFFESVDLDTLVVTDRSNATHTYPDEVLALGYSHALGEMFRTDRGSDLTTIDIVTGETTFVGTFPDSIQMKGIAFDEEIPPPPGGGGVLPDGIRTIFLERGPALGISPMNVVYHPGFQRYYASNGGDPAWSAWVYDEFGNRIQTLESIGVDVRAWTFNPNIVEPTGSQGLEIVSFDAQDGDGGDERGVIHPGVDGAGFLTGGTTNVLAELPGLIDRQTAPSYDPLRNVFYSRALGTLVHVVDRDTGELVGTFDLDFAAAGVIDSDVLGWSLGYDPDLQCLVAADQTYDRALVFELDGSFAGASAIDMDIHRQWGVAYTNGQFFIWSDERNGWQGYLIKVEDDDPCADCPCPEDIDRGGTVDFQDVLVLLAQYGPCPGNENACDFPGVCGTYQVCGTGQPFNCFCWTLYDGTGACYQDFLCDATIDCPDGDCPPGFVCVVENCCGVSKCAPMVTCDDPVYAYEGMSGPTGAGLIIEAGTDRRPRTHAVPPRRMERGIGGGGRLLGLSSDSVGTLYEIDPATGQATLLTDLDVATSLVGLSCVGTGIFGSDLVDPDDGAGFFVGSIDPETGAIGFVSDQDQSANWHGLATDDATGLLWSIDLDDEFILKSLDPVTGVVTSVGTGTGIDGRGMAYDDGAGILYATDGPTNSLYTVDTATGTSMVVGLLGLAASFEVGLAFDEVNRVLYLNDSDTNMLYTVNTATGLATPVGANLAGDAGSLRIDGLAWCVLDSCDACPCPADVNRDGVVDFQDLIAILAAWGPCESVECDDCEDGTVDSCGGGGIGICHLCETPEGDCLCVVGDDCGKLQVCAESGQCPPGFFCCVNTCCLDPVCLPLCDGQADAPVIEPGAVMSGGSSR